jgi:hypothetical protein
MPRWLFTSTIRRSKPGKLHFPGRNPVLETRAFASVRLFLFTRELKSERERVRQAAEALRLPVFSRAVLEQLGARKPDATTAFILGTGASIAK